MRLLSGNLLAKFSEWRQIEALSKPIKERARQSVKQTLQVSAVLRKHTDFSPA